ncbi:MAG TPA: stage II sporulation protein M [Actinomycetota bacterium]|nr:stage II sporulation protein M [Actinomycetota bacterium]
MNLERFLRDRQRDWTELEQLSQRAGRRPDRLGPHELLRLGTLYRAAAADLALARRRWPGDPAVRRLEQAVGQARHLVYDTQTRRESAVRFFTDTYWRRIAERPSVLAAAAVLLFGPWLLASLWALTDPGGASGLVPGEYRSVTEPRTPGRSLGLGVQERAAFSSMIMTNNIQVTFLAFAGGAVAGLGTALVLLFNGTLLGTVSGLAFGAGNGVAFTELVVAHGLLELSCIVVSGAAGLRLGWSIVDPGRLPRSVAVVREGRRAVEMVLGTVPWLVVAGLVEGFITPAGLGLTAAATIGLLLGITFWSLTFWRGTLIPRRRRASDVAGGAVPGPAGAERAADAEGEAQGEPAPAGP